MCLFVLFVFFSMLKMNGEVKVLIKWLRNKVKKLYDLSEKGENFCNLKKIYLNYFSNNGLNNAIQRTFANK